MCGTGFFVRRYPRLGNGIDISNEAEARVYRFHRRRMKVHVPRRAGILGYADVIGVFESIA